MIHNPDRNKRYHLLTLEKGSALELAHATDNVQVGLTWFTKERMRPNGPRHIMLWDSHARCALAKHILWVRADICSQNCE
jgi:hypothetical protein